jgi:two-component system, OmpR family, response regulator
MKQILIVDDDPNVREGLIDILEDAGWKVLAVETGAQALTLLPQFEGTLVLVDYQLPDTTGVALAERLHELHKDVVVLLMTGMSTGDLDPGKMSCIKETLTKPVDPGVLLKRLEQLG